MTTRKCKICNQTYEKQRMGQVVCSPKCAMEYVKQQKIAKQKKAQAAQRKEERAKTKAMKARLESVGDLIKAAQKEFNRYIRLRDKDKPCISCGRPLQQGGGLRGHLFDAGHFRSIGSASHLRFDETNVHGQCVYCNRYHSGNHVNYRQGLIERIGLAEVERLETDNTSRKWSKDELRDLIQQYKEKCKMLDRNPNRIL